MIVSNKMIYEEQYTVSTGACVLTDRTPPEIEDSDDNWHTADMCKDACYERGSECGAIVFNSLTKCGLVIYVGELLSDGTGGYECYSRNPAYVEPPDIVYTEAPGTCALADTETVPATGVTTVRGGLLTTD